jgi:hypothetical protein
MDSQVSETSRILSAMEESRFLVYLDTSAYEKKHKVPPHGVATWVFSLGSNKTKSFSGDWYDAEEFMIRYARSQGISRVELINKKVRSND